MCGPIIATMTVDSATYGHDGIVAKAIEREVNIDRSSRRLNNVSNGDDH